MTREAVQLGVSKASPLRDRNHQENAMRSIPLLIAVAILAWPASAVADDIAKPAASSSDERRLSAEQVEAILADASAKREAATPPVLEEFDGADAQAISPVQGQVGFAIGTGGYREAYGTAIYPLGNDGFAAISLDFIDGGHRRFRH